MQPSLKERRPVVVVDDVSTLLCCSKLINLFHRLIHTRSSESPPAQLVPATATAAVRGPYTLPIGRSLRFRGSKPETGNLTLRWLAAEAGRS